MSTELQELIILMEKTLSNELSSVELHNLFWDTIWGKGDFGASLPDESENPLIDDIFYTFEDFVVIPGVPQDKIPKDLYEGEDNLNEEEFLQKCRELLSKLKELVKNY